MAVTLGVEVREVPALEEVKFLRDQTGFVTCMALSPDGTLLALGSEKKIELWDVASGSCTATLTNHQNWVVAPAFVPGSDFLASGSFGKTVVLWGLPAQTPPDQPRP